MVNTIPGFKGIVQRILSGVVYYAKIIRAGKLEACPFFFLNGTPSQEEHKTIFSG
jgi:hypothetical protein